MIIYFADRMMNILGQASTKLPGGLLISYDKKTESVDTGVKSFEADVEFTDRAAAERMTTPGNYLLRSAEGEAEFYTIIDSELDTELCSIHIYAEDAGLDLLNEVLSDYTASGAMTMAQYIAAFTADSGFEIGVNEVSTLTRTLEWKGESTVAERLLSLANQFDAELSYSFEIKGLRITHKYIDIWKKRGKNTGEELRLGKHIERIRVKKSAANLATALFVTGGTPEGSDNPITLNGYSYDDGDIYVNGNYLMSRLALERWSRYLSPDEVGTGVGHIVKRYSYDTTSQAELCSRAVSQLQKACDLEITYEADVVDLPDSVKVGDTVRVVDASGSLYLEARVLEMTKEETTGNKEIKLGDYVVTESGISAQMSELTKKVAELSQKKIPVAEVVVYTTAINYSAGTATLAATLRVDGVVTAPTSYKWTKGTSTTTIGTGATLNVSDLDAVYNCTVEW